MLNMTPVKKTVRQGLACDVNPFSKVLFLFNNLSFLLTYKNKIWASVNLTKDYKTIAHTNKRLGSITINYL